MNTFESGSWKQILIVLSLEMMFLAFALIFIGYGITEWKKRKQIKPLFSVLLGCILILVGLYTTKLLFNF